MKEKMQGRGNRRPPLVVIRSGVCLNPSLTNKVNASREPELLRFPEMQETRARSTLRHLPANERSVLGIGPSGTRIGELA